MPKSKRDKQISLTKTKKKGLTAKSQLVDKIRENAGQYKHMFIFSYQNLRTNHLKVVREKFRENSRMFLGKTKVIGIALGRTPQEEVGENLHLLSKRLIGNRGLFMTNLEPKEILQYFDSVSIPEFARTGNVATESYEISQGHLTQFPHNMEPHLRKLGLPVRMDKELILLTENYTVCVKGEPLTSDAAKILKLFDEKMAHFKLCMEFQWSDDGTFEDLGRAPGIKLREKVDRPLKSTPVEEEEEDEGIDVPMDED